MYAVTLFYFMFWSFNGCQLDETNMMRSFHVKYYKMFGLHEWLCGNTWRMKEYFIKVKHISNLG